METRHQKSRANLSISRIISLPLVGSIQVYRYFISPMLGQNCRFYPSCSAYAEEAITVHGPVKGSWLASKRICSCHPWHAGGYDPVPPRQSH